MEGYHEVYFPGTNTTEPGGATLINTGTACSRQSDYHQFEKHQAAYPKKGYSPWRMEQRRRQPTCLVQVMVLNDGRADTSSKREGRRIPAKQKEDKTSRTANEGTRPQPHAQLFYIS